MVYITNPVWAAVYRYAGEVFSRNPLHSVVQSAVDGKRQRLETFRNKLIDARRRGFHFEQVRSRNVTRRQSYERNEKSADRWTDRQTAFRLYIVEEDLRMMNIITYSDHLATLYYAEHRGIGIMIVKPSNSNLLLFCF